MCWQRQRHFIGENEDLLADLRIFYNLTDLAFGILKQKPFLLQKSALIMRPELFHQSLWEAILWKLLLEKSFWKHPLAVVANGCFQVGLIVTLPIRLPRLEASACREYSKELYILILSKLRLSKNGSIRLPKVQNGSNSLPKIQIP